MQCTAIRGQPPKRSYKNVQKKRDKKRAENDKRDKERANKNPIKPKNMYTVLMDEGTKNEEEEFEELSKKAGNKGNKKAEKVLKNKKTVYQREYQK